MIERIEKRVWICMLVLVVLVSGMILFSDTAYASSNIVCREGDSISIQRGETKTLTFDLPEDMHKVRWRIGYSFGSVDGFNFVGMKPKLNITGTFVAKSICEFKVTYESGGYNSTYHYNLQVFNPDNDLQYCSVSIDPVAIENFKMSAKLAKTSYKYNGELKKPTASVVLDGTKLKQGTDYVIEYSNNKYVGTAQAKIRLKGEYYGQLYRQFKIKSPGKVKINFYNGKTKVKSKSYSIGKKYGSLPTISKTGYDFNGWYTKKKGGKEVTLDSYVTKSKTYKLYAHMTIHEQSKEAELEN